MKNKIKFCWLDREIKGTFDEASSVIRDIFTDMEGYFDEGSVFFPGWEYEEDKYVPDGKILLKDWNNQKKIIDYNFHGLFEAAEFHHGIYGNDKERAPFWDYLSP